MGCFFTEHCKICDSLRSAHQNFHADRVNEKNKAKIMADKDFSNQNRMDAFNISRYQNKIDLLSTNAATLDPDQCGFVQFQTILKQRREY